MKKCSVCDSTEKVCRFKDGDLYCQKHYNQMYRLGYTTINKKKKRENKIIFDGDIVKMITIKEEIILIDREDYEKTRHFYWSLNSQGYPISVINGKHKRLHLFLIDKPQGMVIDHINGNKLDNRKCNLRICTSKQNAMNTKVAKSNELGILGVSKTKHGRYRARIMVNRKEINLGHYEKIEDAIEARRLAEIKYFGEYAPTLSRDNRIGGN